MDNSFSYSTSKSDIDRKGVNILNTLLERMNFKLVNLISLLSTILFLSMQTASVSMVSASAHVKVEDPSNHILGKWISDEKNLVVEVYKQGSRYNAKILWFRPVDAKTNVVYKTHDVHNPDVKLRTRKIVGIDVVQNLMYNEHNHQWEEGMIYDATLGRQWSAFAYLSPKEVLIVKGYWHLKFLSKTLVFTRFDKTLTDI